MEENKQVTAEEAELILLQRLDGIRVNTYDLGSSPNKRLSWFKSFLKNIRSAGIRVITQQYYDQAQQLTAENERLREVFEDLLGCYIELQNTPNISNATRSLWRKAAGINLTPEP